MIPFDPVDEPREFDARVRKPGNRWLVRNKRDPRPKDYWREIRPQLAAAFRHLCAYSAIHVSYPGTVDHFVPVQGKYGKRKLAYEWSNYRYASHYINCRKGARNPVEMLDPFEVEDGWFEIILPSCQLVLTDKCPVEYRHRAQVMLNDLGLGHDEDVIRYRLEWLKQYRKPNGLSLKQLATYAPLIARAIRKEQRRQAAKNPKHRRIPKPGK